MEAIQYAQLAFPVLWVRGHKLPVPPMPIPFAHLAVRLVYREPFRVMKQQLVLVSTIILARLVLPVLLGKLIDLPLVPKLLTYSVAIVRPVVLAFGA